MTEGRMNPVLFVLAWLLMLFALPTLAIGMLVLFGLVACWAAPEMVLKEMWLMARALMAPLEGKR